LLKNIIPNFQYTKNGQESDWSMGIVQVIRKSKSQILKINIYNNLTNLNAKEKNDR